MRSMVFASLGIGGGYRIGAGGKRGERSAATARPGAHATAVVTFDGRAVFRAAGSDRTSTADAKGSASRCPAPAGNWASRPQQFRGSFNRRAFATTANNLEHRTASALNVTFR
jgi:hypothetical protein